MGSCGRDDFSLAPDRFAITQITATLWASVCREQNQDALLRLQFQMANPSRHPHKWRLHFREAKTVKLSKVT